jgi:hypothetical protein
MEIGTPWMTEASYALRRICPGGLGCSQPACDKQVAKFAAQAGADEAEELWAAAESHGNLRHYRPGPWLSGGLHSINYFLHDKRVTECKARSAGRLTCGGQGLRGGDPVIEPPTRAANCYLPCLLRGIQAVETLRHVFFDCPHYCDCRQMAASQGILAGCGHVLLLHRDVWERKQLASIVDYLDKISQRRAELGSWKAVSGEVDRIWQAELI